MTSRLATAVLTLSACGGAGGIINDDPEARILSASCDKLGGSNSSILVDATFDITLGPGDGFDVQTMALGPQAQSRDFLSCDGWSVVGDFNDPDGCQRDSGQPAHQTLTYQHTEDVATPPPDPIKAQITITVRDRPVIGVALVNDSQAPDCF